MVICRLLPTPDIAFTSITQVNQDPLDVATAGEALIVYRFASSEESYPYTLLLNKFNTVPDHVRQ